jgi:hypothetical protein
MICHYIKNLTKLCMYLLQLMGPQCVQFSDGIYKIMEFADKEYVGFLMDLTVDCTRPVGQPQVDTRG